MKYLILLLTGLLAAGSSEGQQRRQETIECLKSLSGDWEGTITFRKSATDTSFITHPAEYTWNYRHDTVICIRTIHPEDQSATTDSLHYVVKEDAKHVLVENEEWYLSLVYPAYPDTILVIERQVPDPREPAQLRERYTFGNGYFTLLRDIRYNGQADFSKLQEFKLKRIPEPKKKSGK